ncbi:hypothetical protein V8D89_004330 [Ganoderma adspersum]
MAAASIDTHHPFHDLASSLPIADRAALLRLSDNEVRAWSATRADEYRRFALALLSIYNAVATIQRLPVEILSSIFQECWTDRKSLRVGHVCRRWRSVLLSTSRFWANAVKCEKFRPDDRSTGYLGVVLERSAPQVIAPSFRRFSEYISPCLALHADRIVSVVVSLGRHSELIDLWSCLNSGMHHRNLSPLSPTALPRLTAVTAPGSLLHCFALPSLQRITLTNAEGPHPFNHRLESDQYLRNALAICAPRLEVLELIEVVPSGVPQDAPLSLPALRRFVIRDNVRPCSLMLSHLELPHTAHIYAFIDNAGSLRDAVPVNASVIQAALRATNYVGILNASNTLTVHCSAGRRELLTISLANPRTHSLRPDDLVRFFKHKPGPPVAILGVSDVDSRDVHAVDLHAFPHLRAIHTTGLETARHIFGQLARPLNDSDGEGGVRTVRPVCPELEVLGLELEFEFDGQENCDCDEADHASGPVPMGTREAAVIEAHFRALCADVERVLVQRAKMGAKLSRLELVCSEKEQEGSSRKPQWTAETRVSEQWESWGLIVEPLEKLVDGPVNFNGYRCFSECKQELQ